MDTKTLVKRSIRRARGSYQLPELTDERLLMYYDSLRMPEWIRDHAVYDRPGNRAQYTDTSDKYRAILGELEQARRDGLISEEDYARISTIQDYPHADLMELRRKVAYFIPQFWLRCGSDKVICYLNDDNSPTGRNYLYKKGDKWVSEGEDYSCD